MPITSAKELDIKFSHKFFFDTNIWIYLYYPHYSDVDAKIISEYSDFFSNVQKKKCLICTNLVQMSEIVNLIIRLEYQQYRTTNPGISFKDYRSDKASDEALANAKVVTTNILKACNFESGVFNDEEYRDMVSACDKADLNDIYFTKYCIKKDVVLATHDFDFNAIQEDLSLVTLNDNYF